MADKERAMARAKAIARIRRQKEEVDRICAMSQHGSGALLPESAADLYNEALDLLIDVGVKLEPGLRIRSEQIDRPPKWDKKNYPRVPAFLLRSKLDRVLRLYESEGGAE